MKIRIAPGAILLLLALLQHRAPLLPAFLLAAAVHELGHIGAAWALGMRLRALELDVMGAQLTPALPFPSYRAELLLAAAGPAASLLLGCFLLPHAHPFAQLLLTTTLAFALFNLLPIEQFDGGRIVSALLAPFLPVRAAGRVRGALSYTTLLLLFALSSCCLLRYGQNLALAVLCASLFARIFLCAEGSTA